MSVCAGEGGEEQAGGHESSTALGCGPRSRAVFVWKKRRAAGGITRCKAAGGQRGALPGQRRGGSGPPERAPPGSG